MSLKEKILNSPINEMDIRDYKQKEISDIDLKFMSSLRAAVVQKSTKSSMIVLWALLLLFVAFISWAKFTTLDEMTRGQGKIIPSHQIQKVQYLDGGIVSEILIREGAVIKEGDPLIRIEDIGFTTKYRENEIRLYELKAKTARLKAQANGGEIVFDAKIKKEFPLVVKEEQELYKSSLRQLEQKIDIYKEQIVQRKNEISEAKNKIVELSSRYDLTEQEINLTEPLVKKNIVSEVELLKLKRQASSIKEDRDAAKLSIPRLESRLKEIEKTINETRLGFSNSSKKEYNELISEIARIEQTQQFIKDKVSRAVVRSPVDGTVKQLFVNTVGGVINPGRDLIEIVPLEDKLLAEVNIKPSDIAYLHHGQDAIVKFSAYDYSIYGGLKGKVVHISADTITNEKEESFYLVRVETDNSYLGSVEKPLLIKAGMTVTVDILTGKKTVLDYILKPILKAKHNALRER